MSDNPRIVTMTKEMAIRLAIIFVSEEKTIVRNCVAEQGKTKMWFEVKKYETAYHVTVHVLMEDSQEESLIYEQFEYDMFDIIATRDYLYPRNCDLQDTDLAKKAVSLQFSPK